MSVATETRVEFTALGDFKSCLESQSWAPLGQAGDPVVDELLRMVSHASRALDVTGMRGRGLHDVPLRVTVSLHPRSLTLSIRPELEDMYEQ